MFAGNIRWPTVKLSLNRLRNHAYDIYRDGEWRGRVRLHNGTWQFNRSTKLITAPGSYSHDWHERANWRAAVLAVARVSSTTFDAPTVQRYGDCHVVRVQIDTLWYTVITQPTARETLQYIFEDFPPTVTAPDSAAAVRLRKALAAALQDTEKL